MQSEGCFIMADEIRNSVTSRAARDVIASTELEEGPAASTDAIDLVQRVIEGQISGDDAVRQLLRARDA